MSQLPDQIFRKWVHSFEEDAGALRVYRPAEYAFPRARGRAGIELRPDGTFIDWAIGPTDAQRPDYGRWEPAGQGRLRVTHGASGARAEQLEVVQCDADILKLRP